MGRHLSPDEKHYIQHSPLPSYQLADEFGVVQATINRIRAHKREPKPLVSVICDECGTVFTRSAWLVRDTHNYCKPSCAVAARKHKLAQLVCDGCGITFHRKRAWVKDRTWVFHNRECWRQHRGICYGA